MEEIKLDRVQETSATPPMMRAAFYDCKICGNRGNLLRRDKTGILWGRECACMPIRRNLRRLERSGLAGAVQELTFDAWTVERSWQQKALDVAKAYAENPQGWLLAAGNVGTGKTHLCTAICGVLLRRGLDLRYVMWRELAQKAKAAVNDSARYAEIVEPLKAADVVYIDDLFKSKRGQEVTAGDINLAFYLLNARYADRKKLTILSTELGIEKIMDIDEAIGSRIYERTKGHRIVIEGGENWRLTHG